MRQNKNKKKHLNSHILRNDQETLLETSHNLLTNNKNTQNTHKY